MDRTNSMDHKLRRMFTSILSVFVIAAIAFPTGGGVFAEGPMPRIVASVAGDWFWTSDFAPGPLNIFIFESQESGAALLWEGSRDTDESGFVMVGFDDHQVDLQPGNLIAISDGVTEKSLVLEVITMDVFDLGREFMAGTAPAGRYVRAVAGMAEAETQAYFGLTADPVNGVWKADFSTIPFDIVEEMRPWSFAQIFDEDGDANEANPSEFSTMPMWRDDFDSGIPAAGWFWENGDSGDWDPGAEPGFLRLHASDTPTTEGNLLLKLIPQGDFTIKTHLFFEPDTNYQFAGLVIYQDDANFLQFGRAFCNEEGFCAGNGIYFDKVIGGNTIDGNFARSVDNPSEAYLRLERRGGEVIAYYSYEGITWFEIGRHWIPEDFQVNGVGLTASQDFFTEETDITADFDFFEVTEGWGFLPYGFHDYDEGDVPRWNCGAGGWAADPDDPAADLAIEIDVDGVPLENWLSAGDYREDLDNAGVCVDGNCAFSTSLWGVISSYEPHSVVAYAQDVPSGEWVQLSNSPKTITCRTYDIYAYDPLTGGTRAISDLRDKDESNPSWSPNGKKIVHDVVNEDGSQGIYLTDLRTGSSGPLTGADDGGNDAVWSPNGKWIAFDRYWYDDPNLYLVPSTGGNRMLVVSDAIAAGWAPNGKRLVFQRPSDGSLMTAPVNGGQGVETRITGSGTAPSWSPDGNWIAYENEGDIWKVAVNVQGQVLGEPVQVTSGPFQDAHPTWSPDSLNIIFTSGMGDDSDLWTVPAAGGDRTWLTGAQVFGDYDPDHARNSQRIAYASFSPEGQAARKWAAAYTFDAGTWSVGDHNYRLQSAYSIPEPGGGESPPVIPFNVSNEAPEYPGMVLMRGLALRAFVDGSCPALDPPVIRPTQPTLFHYIWVTDTPMTPSEALAHFDGDNLRVTAYWDDMSADLQRQEIFPATPPVDFGRFTCSFTGN